MCAPAYVCKMEFQTTLGSCVSSVQLPPLKPKQLPLTVHTWYGFVITKHKQDRPECLLLSRLFNITRSLRQFARFKYFCLLLNELVAVITQHSTHAGSIVLYDARLYNAVRNGFCHQHLRTCESVKNRWPMRTILDRCHGRTNSIASIGISRKKCLGGKGGADNWIVNTHKSIQNSPQAILSICSY